MEETIQETASGDEGSVTEEPSQAPTQEEGSEEQVSEGVGEEGRIPMSRWNAKLQAERELRAQVQTLNEQVQSNQRAAEFYNALMADPQKFEAINRVLLGNEQKGPEKDPYENFAPEVADKFRELDRLKQEQQEFRAWKANQEKTYVETERGNLDNEFDNLLKKDGHIDKDGKYDEKFVNTLGEAVLARMVRIAKNPSLPSRDELHRAYKEVTEGFSAYEKNILTKRTRPDAPPSGQKTSNSLPTGKKITEQDRLNVWM